MRSLRNKDLFAFTRMVKEAGIDQEIKALVMKINNIKDISSESFGYDIMFTLFNATAEKENEQKLYNFLSGPFEMDPEEIAEMELTDTYEALKQVADVNKWKGFFISAANMTKSN